MSQEHDLNLAGQSVGELKGGKFLHQLSEYQLIGYDSVRP
jgi:hypothetical protein